MSEKVHRKIITEAAHDLFGLVPVAWLSDNKGERLVKAAFGRWRALADTEEGLVTGEEGELHAIVVGSKKSRRVAFYFAADGMDADPEVRSSPSTTSSR